MLAGLYSKGKNLRPEKVEQKDRTVSHDCETTPEVFCGGTSRILVRAKYEETKRAALEEDASPTEAFLVTGQPGIGPSPPVPSSTELSL